MIAHSTSTRPGAVTSSPSSELSDSNDRDHDPAARVEGDPFRQLFHRHANHLNSAQTRGIQARLRDRLFAGDSELG